MVYAVVHVLFLYQPVVSVFLYNVVTLPDVPPLGSNVIALQLAFHVAVNVALPLYTPKFV